MTTQPFTIEVVWPDRKVETWKKADRQGSARADARVAYRWHRDRGMLVRRTRVRYRGLSTDEVVYSYPDGG